MASGPTAQSITRSHWLHCHWERPSSQMAHPSGRGPGSRKWGLEPLEKHNCPELEEPKLLPS